MPEYRNQDITAVITSDLLQSDALAEITATSVPQPQHHVEKIDVAHSNRNCPGCFRAVGGVSSPYPGTRVVKRIQSHGLRPREENGEKAVGLRPTIRWGAHFLS